MKGDKKHWGVISGKVAALWSAVKSTIKIPPTGWRRTAIALTILITFFALSLFALLIRSLYFLGDENGTILSQSLLFKGRCSEVSRANLWIHLLTNTMASAILASSNFFMQTLVAPTRKDIDNAHTTGKWVEIGVQSIWNMRFVPRRQVIAWFLFALSSVPFHLLINGAILKSKVSTGFMLVIAYESFLDGPPEQQTEITGTVLKIWESVSANESNKSWERVNFTECMNRYNESSITLTQYRHAVMVVGRGTPTGKWSSKSKSDKPYTRQDPYLNSSGPVLWTHSYDRTDMGINSGQSEGISSPKDGFDFSLGNLSGDMKVFYCMSEKFQIDCQITTASSILLIVCIMCAFKLLLCILCLRLPFPSDCAPLLTPEDAIESFITRPDETTKGMCTLDFKDLVDNEISTQDGFSAPIESKWRAAPRPLRNQPREAGTSVPKLIWFISYAMITCSLGMAISIFILSIYSQPIEASHFGHGIENSIVNVSWLHFTSMIGLTMVANTPQLILSLCYLAYNGLLTRMLAEFEWARYSIVFQGLRVSNPQGQQLSTYRLQLPYRWSIPLLVISILLHWVYSNCIYVTNYNGYDAEWPYHFKLTQNLQYSTVAILTALILSVIVFVTPLFLASVKLPGEMVIAGSRSAIISAACHCIPMAGLESSKLRPMDETLEHENNEHELSSLRLMEDTETAILQTMARSKLKWGKISVPGNETIPIRLRTKHLAFGIEEQNVTTPFEGAMYI